MRRLRWLRGQDVSVLFAIIAVIVIPAMFTLNTVKVPITGSDVKLNPTPLGYTVSLLIYLVPVLALYWWFSRRCPEGDGALRRNSRVVLGRRSNHSSNSCAPVTTTRDGGTSCNATASRF